MVKVRLEDICDIVTFIGSNNSYILTILDKEDIERFFLGYLKEIYTKIIWKWFPYVYINITINGKDDIGVNNNIIQFYGYGDFYMLTVLNKKEGCFDLKLSIYKKNEKWFIEDDYYNFTLSTCEAEYFGKRCLPSSNLNDWNGTTERSRLIMKYLKKVYSKIT